MVFQRAREKKLGQHPLFLWLTEVPVHLSRRWVNFFRDKWPRVSWKLKRVILIICPIVFRRETHNVPVPPVSLLPTMSAFALMLSARMKTRHAKLRNPLWRTTVPERTFPFLLFWSSREMPISSSKNWWRITPFNLKCHGRFQILMIASNTIFGMFPPTHWARLSCKISDHLPMPWDPMLTSHPTCTFTMESAHIA